MKNGDVMFGTMPKLKIGKLTAKTPIIQGGMGVGISLSGLSSAVANEGGIGVIAAVGLGMAGSNNLDKIYEENARQLQNEIRIARKKSNGLIGVNIMMALSDHENLLKVTVEAKADLALVGAGLLLKLPPTIEKLGIENIHTEFVPIVSSGRAAKIIFKQWAKRYNTVPSAVVVEGPLAGGHLGFKAEALNNPDNNLKSLLADVLVAVQPFKETFNKPIPVIVAGGVYSGADIYNFLRAGASGVQMATRFVATHECDADIGFKEAFVECKKDDMIIIKSPVGLPGRAINNKFLESVEQGNKKPFKCPWKCLHTCDVNTAPYCIANALISARKGRLKSGFAFAGSNAYKIDKIISVKELVETIKTEYKTESMIKRKLSKSDIHISIQPDYCANQRVVSAI